MEPWGIEMHKLKCAINVKYIYFYTISESQYKKDVNFYVDYVLK
jgi:hypothetical protein